MGEATEEAGIDQREKKKKETTTKRLRELTLDLTRKNPLQRK